MSRSTFVAAGPQPGPAEPPRPVLHASWGTEPVITKPKIPDALLEHRARRAPLPSPLDQGLNHLLKYEEESEHVTGMRFSPAFLDYLTCAVAQLVERFELYQKTGETTIPNIGAWQQFYKEGQEAVEQVYAEAGVHRMDLSKQFKEKYHEAFPITRPRRGKPPDPERLVCQLVIELCVRRYLKDVLESLGATCVVEEAEASK